MPTLPNETAPQPGPQNALTNTPSRRPGSVRRTTTTDMTFPGGIGGTVVADIRGRDLYTDARGDGTVVDELALSMAIEPWTGAIVDVTVTSASIRLDKIVGLALRGFARQVAELYPDEATQRSLCYSALEDLGGAQLVSGYAGLRARPIEMAPEHVELAIATQGDACVGWALDGAAIANIRVNGQHAVPIGPAAPALELDDPLSWHAFAPLPPGSVRRRRRTDVFAAPSDSTRIDAEHHFRDSYAAADGETVMHEYLVEATLDEDRRLVSVDVDARVLPWHECPGAVPSAQRMLGVRLDELAARVRADLKGATTCTHLNSTLRTLADVRTLDGYRTGYGLSAS
jgi:hypothetical protein